MAKKATAPKSSEPKRSSPVAEFRKHEVAKGACAVCGRSGSELKASCPGYRTAAEYIKDWSRKPTPAAKKGGKKHAAKKA